MALVVKGAAEAHGKKLFGRSSTERKGSTQVQSLGVTTVVRLSKPPAPWPLVFRMAQPPSRGCVS